jgi:hypothetical protein
VLGQTSTTTAPATEINDSVNDTSTTNLTSAYRIVAPGTFSIAGTWSATPGQALVEIVGYAEAVRRDGSYPPPKPLLMKMRGTGWRFPAINFRLPFFDVSTGSAPELLQAVVNGVSTTAALLTVGKPVQGVVTGTSTTAARLTVGKPLKAVVNGSSTAAALLTVGKPLKAVATGTSTVSALFTDGKPLKGVVTGTSSTAARLTLGKPIAALVTASSSVSTAAFTLGTPSRP